MRPVHVIGVGMTKFGKFPQVGIDDLGAQAARAAFADAGVGPRQIQSMWCGHVFQGPVAGQRIAAKVGLSGIPVANVENYCSSGSTAIRDAWIAVGAGVYDVVLVVGAEKLHGKISDGILPDADDIEGALGLVMSAQYSMRFKLHSEKYGTTREQLAKVAVKNHGNSTLNPNSQYRNPVTVEEVLASKPIVDPINLLDCCPIGDGAAAVVLCDEATARRLGRKSVRLVASALTSGRYQQGLADITFETITDDCAKTAYEMAGIGPEDVDVAEVHDCFTMAEILRVEGLGLCPPGEYGRHLDEGRWSIGGKTPINTSGGLLSKGHPLGATGVAQVCEVTWQLRGEAGDRQVDDPKVGLAHCRGGTVYGTDGGSCTIQVLTL